MTLSETLYPKSLLSIRAGCFALNIESMLYMAVNVLPLPHIAMMGLSGGTVMTLSETLYT